MKMNGNFLLILATIVSWGLGSVFFKLAGQSTHPLMTATITTGLYVVFLPIAFWFLKLDFAVGSWGFIFSLLGGFVMSCGTLCFMLALRTGGAGVITAATSVYPGLTLLISAFFLGEELGWRKLFGCVLAVVSVMMLAGK